VFVCVCTCLHLCVYDRRSNGRYSIHEIQIHQIRLHRDNYCFHTRAHDTHTHIYTHKTHKLYAHVHTAWNDAILAQIISGAMFCAPVNVPPRQGSALFRGTYTHTHTYGKFTETIAQTKTRIFILRTQHKYTEAFFLSSYYNLHQYVCMYVYVCVCLCVHMCVCVCVSRTTLSFGLSVLVP